MEKLNSLVSSKHNIKHDPSDSHEIQKVLDTDVFSDPAFHGIITEELRDDDLPAD